MGEERPLLRRGVGAVGLHRRRLRTREYDPVPQGYSRGVLVRGNAGEQSGRAAPPRALASWASSWGARAAREWGRPAAPPAAYSRAPTVPEGVLSGTLIIACTRMRTGRRSNAGVLRVSRLLHLCLSHRRTWLRLRRVRVLSTTSTHGVLVGHGYSWGTRARHTLCNDLRACVFERPPTEPHQTVSARSESTQEMCANGWQ